MPISRSLPPLRRASQHIPLPIPATLTLYLVKGPQVVLISWGTQQVLKRSTKSFAPFLYANGHSVDLTPLLPPLDGGYASFATAINIRDQVVGYQDISPQSFLYQNGKR